jgi:hypothetical protein
MPIASTMRLVDPTTSTELLSVGPFTSTVLNSLDLAYPDVRGSAQVRSGAHGTNDNTRYVGARSITAQMTLPQGVAADAACDLIAGLCNPGLRLYLYAQRPGWPAERRVMVRGAAFTCPPGTNRQGQAQFTAPLGLLQSVTATTVTLAPAGPSTTGRGVPRSVPSTYTGGLSAGAALVNVDGNVPAPPIVDIYGPCSNPLIRCVDTGAQLSFAGLTLAAGEYLHVDVENHRVWLNGDPTQNRYNALDFASSTWWTLPDTAGVQVLFSADAASGACQAVLSFYPRWL